MKKKMKNFSPKFESKKGFENITGILGNHPQSKILGKALHRHQALMAWEKAAAQFFEEAREKTRAVDFKDGVLFIACLSKDLNYKIKLFAQRIIYILNQLLGKELVSALKIEC